MMTMNKNRTVQSTGLLLVLSGLVAWACGVWLSLPFGLIYSVIIPGSLLFLFIKRQIIIDWESVVQIVGLGISFVIFSTLVENWLLRAAGVGRPLTHALLFLTFGILNIVLICLGYRRWDSNAIMMRNPGLTRYDKFTIASSFMLLLCFILGAIRLNNGASGGLTTLCYLFGPLLVLWLFVQSNKLKKGTIILSVWLLGLGVLLSGWLRSNYVAGPDLDIEFQLFQLVKSTGYWSVGLSHNAYNACLSLGLLPTALSYMTKLPDLLIFKFLIPAIYSLIIPLVFMIANSAVKKRAAILATFFFIAQPPFATWSWIPIRQEVALLFFALLVFLLIQPRHDRSKQILILIFGTSMVVSHYSTSYIALGLFLILNILQWAVRKSKRIKLKPHFVLKPPLLVALFLITYLWYSQLTFGFTGATQFITKSIQNIDLLFSSDVQQQGQAPLDHLNIFSKPGATDVSSFDYAQSKTQQAQEHSQANRYYNPPTDNSYDPLAPYTPASSRLADHISQGRNILKVGGNLLVSFGVIIIAIIALIKKRAKTLNFLQVSALLFIVIATFLPFFSISYGEDRLYQQLLIIIAASICVWGDEVFSKVQWKKFITAGLFIFVTSYYLFLNQVAFQFTDSPQKNIAMNNSGTQYLEYYIFNSDAQASRWLAQQGGNASVYGDSFTLYRLVTNTNLQMLSRFHNGVVPGALPKASYVYQSSVNTSTATAFDRYSGSVVAYRFPTNFLSSEKNTVYTNKMDNIYR